jgi:hypothetical protein
MDEGRQQWRPFSFSGSRSIAWKAAICLPAGLQPREA